MQLNCHLYCTLLGFNSWVQFGWADSTAQFQETLDVHDTFGDSDKRFKAVQRVSFR